MAFYQTNNRPSRRKNPILAGLFLLGLLLLAACGPTALIHVDGEPFLEHEPRIALPNGWIAIDSCATGAHALMVVEVDAVHSLPVVPRWVHSHELGTLRDFRIEGPWCRTDYEMFYADEDDDHPWTRKFSNTHGKEHCVYRLRAEYTMPQPTLTSDSLFIAHLQSISTQ